MKLGILGTGKIVREFLPWLAEHTPFTVQAICSTERSAELAQSLCGQYGSAAAHHQFSGTAAVGGCGVHCSAEPAACAAMPAWRWKQANMLLWKSRWHPRRPRLKNW
ncbi:MAG: hypothetical protein ACLVJH_03075 [Faecalibacterium prausnitzii]